MSLSEKAKLALGRPNAQDTPSPRTGLNGIAKPAVAAVGAAGAAAAANRAFANDGDVAIAEAPPVAEARANPVVHETAPQLEAEPHPLDGLDDQLAGQTAAAKAPIDSYADHSAANPVAKPSGAVIEIQNGAKSGQVLPIDKPVTTLGRPGIQIAAIMRKPDGYFLMHIESDDSVEMPTLNRDAIGDDPVMLQSGDRLNVAGIDVEFSLA